MHVLHYQWCAILTNRPANQLFKHLYRSSFFSFHFNVNRRQRVVWSIFQSSIDTILTKSALQRMQLSHPIHFESVVFAFSILVRSWCACGYAHIICAVNASDIQECFDIEIFFDVFLFIFVFSNRCKWMMRHDAFAVTMCDRND